MAIEVPHCDVVILKGEILVRFNLRNERHKLFFGFFQIR